jgi:hypothetical protein
MKATIQSTTIYPDPPSKRYNLPFNKPFDRFMVLSKIEGLTALN